MIVMERVSDFDCRTHRLFRALKGVVVPREDIAHEVSRLPYV